ncbi:MAG: DUF512 domain-containing protein [Lachnospiraceae bacterium]
MEKKNNQKHRISVVAPGSIAQEMGIETGDYLLAINDQEVKDIFDFLYLSEDSYLEVLIEKSDGNTWLLEIDKDEDEPLGVTFENPLMDDYKSCQNHCVFCFIDQMPPGMRDTLYFKDDDSRLSFMQGNYVTLTNMSDEDIDRIIRYHLTPINISVHTTNPQLRCQMLHNRFAGNIQERLKRLYDAQIEMNAQIVLCKGYNDGEELERTIHDLAAYLPYMGSLSVVPVGLTKFRQGLTPLEPFSEQDAREVLQIIHKWQNILLKAYDTHFVHASDEWYILAGLPFPEEDSYDGYPQIENGVGMMTSFLNEFDCAFEAVKGDLVQRTLSMATGKLAFPYFKTLSERISEKFPNTTLYVYEIENDYFGPMITVAGLITGTDLMRQLRDKPLGDKLCLPSVMLRAEGDRFLDDITWKELENALQVPIEIVKSSGEDFVNAVLSGGERK